MESPLEVRFELEMRVELQPALTFDKAWHFLVTSKHLLRCLCSLRSQTFPRYWRPQNPPQNLKKRLRTRPTFRARRCLLWLKFRDRQLGNIYRDMLVFIHLVSSKFSPALAPPQSNAKPKAAAALEAPFWGKSLLAPALVCEIGNGGIVTGVCVLSALI